MQCAESYGASKYTRVIFPQKRGLRKVGGEGLKIHKIKMEKWTRVKKRKLPIKKKPLKFEEVYHI